MSNSVCKPCRDECSKVAGEARAGSDAARMISAMKVKEDAMTRGEIVREVKRSGVYVATPAPLVTWLDLLERAGLCVIPAVADEQEIERVARKLCGKHYGEKHVDLNWQVYAEEARAAAAAVREGGKP